jgi:saccharopine dehydrogenase-like NADP-dependent oxidoreductase
VVSERFSILFTAALCLLGGQVDIGDALAVASVLKNFAPRVGVSSLLRYMPLTAPAVVINTCGPFGPDSMRLAEQCIRAGTHYVDLADSRLGLTFATSTDIVVVTTRAFVEGIAALDAAARQARVLVASGASSVPALSSAVVGRSLRLVLRRSLRMEC